MDQSARLAWYHDHAMGLTRTNAYSGIASALVITDSFESQLVNGGHLPDLIGIPLVIQDKTFVANNILDQDPTWQWGGPGSVWYPHVYEPTLTGGTGPMPACMVNAAGRWDYGPCAGAVLPDAAHYTLPAPASIVPEAFFDTILVNGGVYPVVTVPPRRVRLRMLNGSQARFYHLNLYAESASTAGEADTTRPSPTLYQVGTEGGFLPAVAAHSNGIPCPLDLLGDPTGNTAIPAGPFNLLLAPAERADVVIDFAGLTGKTFILYNDAPAPFPRGDPRNDYFTGDPDQTDIGGAPSTVSGYGPNTRTLLRIVVGTGTTDSVKTSAWLPPLNSLLTKNFRTGNQPALLYGSNSDPATPRFPYTSPPAGATVRQLTLNEDFDDFGRLIQTLGTTTSHSFENAGANTWGLPYTATPTETPTAGAVEVWQLYNLTGDAHPIHFHLVNVQVIQRQQFTGDPAVGIKLQGSPRPPDANELGWKETVRMNPGEVTTIIAQFTLPKLPATFGNPLSPRTGGHEYVWHCHILEHEEHDMMRPLVVS
jgi:spore coat protein A